MFWIKVQSKTEKKLSQMQSLLIKSFTNVKNDTQKLFQWMNFLYQKNLEQENHIKQLKLELEYIPKKPEDIRKIIDSYYSFDNITERIKLISEKVDNLKSVQPKIYPQTHPAIHEIEQRLAQLEEQKQATIREKVVKRVTRNSKEYVKSLILSYIRKYTQISSLQLKDMIVYDQGLCSKSSFYRLLDDIETMEEIGTIKKGREKEKYYLYKQMKEQ